MKKKTFVLLLVITLFTALSVFSISIFAQGDVEPDTPTNIPDGTTSTLEPVEATPEPVTPTIELETPTPDQSTPTPDISTPTPDNSTDLPATPTNNGGLVDPDYYEANGVSKIEANEYLANFDEVMASSNMDINTDATEKRELPQTGENDSDFVFGGFLLIILGLGIYGKKLIKN